MTYEDLKEYLGIRNDTSSDAYVIQCWETAKLLVANFRLGNFIPEEVENRAVLITASNLYYERKTQLGIQQFTGGDGESTPVRVSRDPMTGAYELLRQFMVVGL